MPSQVGTPRRDAPQAAVTSRVLLVDLACGFGGAEVRVLTLARTLQRTVADCRVAVLRDHPLHARLLAENLPALPLDRGRGDPRLLLELRRLIRAGGFTVVDAHNVQSIFWGHLAAVLAGVPGRVATIHSDHAGEYPGTKGFIYESVLRLDRHLSRETVVVSKVLLARYRREGDAHCTLVPNAVSVPARPPAAADAAARRVWGCTPGDFVVVVPARLHPVKGHRHLLEAVARLKGTPRTVVLAAGEGPLRRELEDLAAALGLGDRVRFLGFVTDTASLLLAADCVCLPSLTEAMPYAILEAAAFARPILATAVGGIPDLIEHGRTGVLVPSKNPEALAAALGWLAGHPEEARRIGLAAYEMAKSDFGVGAMLERTLEVYGRSLS